MLKVRLKGNARAGPRESAGVRCSGYPTDAPTLEGSLPTPRPKWRAMRGTRGPRAYRRSPATWYAWPSSSFVPDHARRRAEVETQTPELIPCRIGSLCRQHLASCRSQRSYLERWLFRLGCPAKLHVDQ